MLCIVLCTLDCCMNQIPKDVWKIILRFLHPHDASAFMCVCKMTNQILKFCEKSEIIKIARITNLAIKHQQKRCNTARKYVLKHYFVCSQCGILLSRGKSYFHIRNCTGAIKKGTPRPRIRYLGEHYDKHRYDKYTNI